MSSIPFILSIPLRVFRASRITCTRFKNVLSIPLRVFRGWKEWDQEHMHLSIPLRVFRAVPRPPNPTRPLHAFNSLAGISQKHNLDTKRSYIIRFQFPCGYFGIHIAYFVYHKTYHFQFPCGYFLEAVVALAGLAVVLSIPLRVFRPPTTEDLAVEELAFQLPCGYFIPKPT